MCKETRNPLNIVTSIFKEHLSSHAELRRQQCEYMSSAQADWPRPHTHTPTPAAAHGDKFPFPLGRWKMHVAQNRDKSTMECEK